MRLGLPIARRTAVMGPPPDPNREEYPYVGTINFQGILIYVENEPGSIREGVDAAGQPWRTKFKVYYGEIPGTRASDNMPIDVFIGDVPSSPLAFVLHSKNSVSTEYRVAGTYDEDKVMLGYPTLEEALQSYADHYNEPMPIPGVTVLPVDELRERLECPCEGKMGALTKAGFPKTLPGGLAEKDKKKPSDFDPKELEMGIKVEHEHLVGGGYTEEEMNRVASEIAMDHLTEIPDYYTRLKRMEKEALNKAQGKPPGEGWQAIPKGQRGGWRRRKKSGPGWEYYYPKAAGKGGGGGEGKEVTINRKQLIDLIENGDYSIISAGRNRQDPKEALMREDDPFFVERHNKLLADLRAAGFKYTLGEGFYDGRELSIVVFHHPNAKPKAGRAAAIVMHSGDQPQSQYAKIRELGTKYNQDSVIHSRKGVNECHYTTGPHAEKKEFVRGTGYDLRDDAQDFYSIFAGRNIPKGPDGNYSVEDGTKYSLRIGWDDYRPHEEALLKSKGGNKPPGSGWESIPRGRKGGYRRRLKGKRGWEYWYPTGMIVKPSKKAAAKKKKEPPPPPPKPAKVTVKVGGEEMEVSGDWGETQEMLPTSEAPHATARKTVVYKRSQAQKNSIVWKLENGVYGLRQHQSKFARRARLTVEVPGDAKDPNSEKSKLVKEVTNVFHAAAREIGKRWGVSPLHASNPDYMELVSAAHVGFVMCLANYQGGRAFIPYLLDYCKAYCLQAVRQMRRGVTIPDSKMVVLSGFAAAKTRARTLAREKNNEEPSAEDIAKNWYLTKRMVWTGRAETLGSYHGERKNPDTGKMEPAIIDQAHEQVPMKGTWQVRTPTGDSAGKEFPGKVQLVAVMERMLAGSDVKDEEWLAFHEREALPDHSADMLPAGTVYQLRKEINDIAATIKEPWRSALLMRMGMYEPVEEDDKRLAEMSQTKIKALAKEHGLNTAGSKTEIAARLKEWSVNQDRPGVAGRQATASEIADSLQLFAEDKKGRKKPSGTRAAATRRLLQLAWDELWEKAKQRKAYVAQFLEEWDVAAQVTEQMKEQEPKRVHSTWFPSNTEMKDRFGTDERVQIYQAAIRAGKAMEVGDILDAEKRGEASAEERRWVRELYHEQRHRDAQQAFERYHAYAADPTKVRETGAEAGTPTEATWLYTETILSDYARARGLAPVDTRAEEERKWARVMLPIEIEQKKRIDEEPEKAPKAGKKKSGRGRKK